MKCLFLSNQSRTMYVFWRVLIEAMQKDGMEISCCVPGGDPESDASLKALGCRIIHYELDRKGLNPFADLKTLAQIRKILKNEAPDIIFATTIKPVIYGGIAARLAKSPGFFATITGLGYAFEADSLPKKLINRLAGLLYRAGLSGAKAVFFQNQDDASVFREQGILAPGLPVFFARGTGVDTDRFAQAPLPGGPVTFLLVARLLEAKGIADYAEAARLLKKRFPKARFQLLGSQESGPGSLSMKQIRAWQEQCGLEYLGQTADVRPFLANAHVAVLPSWREGTPTSLLEAMSMGRPLVATDVPGCREVVRPGENGYLAEVRNPVALAQAMQHFLEDEGLAERMGQKSRELALREFAADRVASGIIADIKTSLGKTG